ncbi:monovalent cation/H(+) antiporter subunit G [Halomonas nitroreducens]|uniref:Monovalent cation/H(+) antiporter subunit G n=1 Tax=Halomonas nitroreducens TaxID=447425 RepID=A0A3S0JXR2_9GAMM|nr:monovalent cation/H(+) antiporter subunit G [Halomonas nitroreducens]RTR03814.1 monovalent cation/H(+) antiporter subunit G [Halomonas nitroreducens]
MIEWLEVGMILAGTTFMLVAALGVVRLPDLLTRMHATTKAATLGVSLIMLAVALHFDEAGVVARALGVVLFLMMTAPVAAHVIGRAGYFVGTRLWSGTVKDELRPHYHPLSHRLDSGLEAPGEPSDPGPRDPS